MKLLRMMRLMIPHADASVLDTLALEPPLLAVPGDSDLFPFLVVILNIYVHNEFTEIVRELNFHLIWKSNCNIVKEFELRGV